ncbi:MAG: hypothetical protein K8T10_11845 [Candidatus Eremiobacteraeota bacterium]|nr:hypothetical protein [Candidatus Eremiobacteraeota bacterium]
MDVKKYFTTHNIIMAVVVIILGLFFWFYPIRIKNEIINAYRKGLKKASVDLDKHERKAADDAMTHIEKGELFESHEHDTGDFMHQDYFGEPWREWASTFIVWEKARWLFYLFIILLLLRPFLNKIVDRINIINLKLKGVDASADQAVQKGSGDL